MQDAVSAHWCRRAAVICTKRADEQPPHVSQRAEAHLARIPAAELEPYQTSSATSTASVLNECFDAGPAAACGRTRGTRARATARPPHAAERAARAKRVSGRRPDELELKQPGKRDFTESTLEEGTVSSSQRS
eukprot:404876-Prymnesium_polylepis.1